jgi:hypothetical protein
MALATAADGKNLVTTVPCFAQREVFVELLVARPMSRGEQIRGGSLPIPLGGGGRDGQTEDHQKLRSDNPTPRGFGVPLIARAWCRPSVNLVTSPAAAGTMGEVSA